MLLPDRSDTRCTAGLVMMILLRPDIRAECHALALHFRAGIKKKVITDGRIASLRQMPRKREKEIMMDFLSKHISPHAVRRRYRYTGAMTPALPRHRIESALLLLRAHFAAPAAFLLRIAAPQHTYLLSLLRSAITPPVTMPTLSRPAPA